MPQAWIQTGQAPCSRGSIATGIRPHHRGRTRSSHRAFEGAVGYQLRLIPSNKVLARFESTLEAWPVIIATIEGGRSPRTLALDAILTDGTVVMGSAGPRSEKWGP